MNVVCSGPKMKRTNYIVISKQVQKPGSVMVWGCINDLGKGHLNLCDGSINAEKYTLHNAKSYSEVFEAYVGGLFVTKHF